jgi:hypothetical protein
MFCPSCGTEADTGAGFCGQCGARLSEDVATGPEARTAEARASAATRAKSGRLLVMLAVAASAVLGLAALFDAVANDGNWADSILGAGAAKTPEASVTPSPSATAEPGQTLEPSPSAGPAETPASPMYFTPQEAIAAFMEDIGFRYAGDCADLDVETDVGAYCTSIWEDTVDTKIYRSGLAFSEYGMWLLVSRLGAQDDWTVVDFADLVEGEPPPW